MYFDGQLHYLEKERQSSSMAQQTADPNTSSTVSSPQQPLTQAQTQEHPQPSSSSTAPSSSMPKSQTVGGPAGDLHSMALKSAISNIGLLPKKFLSNWKQHRIL
jgi:hypothetical protein